MHVKQPGRLPMRMPDSLLSGTRAVADRRGKESLSSVHGVVSDTVSTPQGVDLRDQGADGKVVAHDCPLSAEHTSLVMPGSVA